MAEACMTAFVAHGHELWDIIYWTAIMDISKFTDIWFHVRIGWLGELAWGGLWLWLLALVTYDKWYPTCDTWHPTGNWYLIKQIYLYKIYYICFVSVLLDLLSSVGGIFCCCTANKLNTFYNKSNHKEYNNTWGSPRSHSHSNPKILTTLKVSRNSYCTK